MATVHLGRLQGVVGFSKTVAIKRLHPQYAKDPEFVSMFLDEARLAARIRHPNVVSTLDVVALEGELFVVMEYVQGESLLALLRSANRQEERIPPEIVSSIFAGTLHGLHAAHEARSERNEPLGIVHRDVSPQNVLVGIDGVPRVLDFGVAKATGRVQTTRDGQVKGKLAYMSPEQLVGTVSRATDVFAASVVLWEALVGKRLFGGGSEGETVKRVLDQEIQAPGKIVPGLPPELDDLVMRGLQRDPAARFATAREMARALEKAVKLAPASEVGEYVEKMAGPTLAKRAEWVARIESSSPTLLLHEGAKGDTTVDGAPTRVDATTPPVHGDEGSAGGTDPNGSRSLRPQPSALRRRTIRRIVGSAIGVSAAVLLLAVGIAVGSGRSPTTPSASASVAAESPLPAVPPAPTTASDDVPSAPSNTNTASAAASPSPPPTGPTARSQSPARPAPAPASPPPRRAAAGCDPPYTVDANGFHHYKKECLR